MLIQFLKLIIPSLFLLSACITGQNQGLNPSAVQATIVAKYPNIQKCYTRSIGDEGHAGVIKADFLIDGNGKAKAIKLIDESLGTDKLNECLAREIEDLTFPKPKGGIDVAVSYPFKFEADTKLTQAAIMNVLKGAGTSLCYEEIAKAKSLKVKLTIGKQGRVRKTVKAFDETELKGSSPCLARVLQKQKFPKIKSKQFQTVSIVVTFEADETLKISQTR